MYRSWYGSDGCGGTTYVNAPTSSGRRQHRWKASKMFHFDTRTGPLVGSASHICCSSCVKHAPNWITFALDNMLMKVSTYRAIESGTS